MCSLFHGTDQAYSQHHLRYETKLHSLLGCYGLVNQNQQLQELASLLERVPGMFGYSGWSGLGVGFLSRLLPLLLRLPRLASWRVFFLLGILASIGRLGTFLAAFQEVQIP